MVQRWKETVLQECITLEVYLYIPNTKSKVNKLQCITNVSGEKKFFVLFCVIFFLFLGYSYLKFIEYWRSARTQAYHFFLENYAFFSDKYIL